MGTLDDPSWPPPRRPSYARAQIREGMDIAGLLCTQGTMGDTLCPRPTPPNLCAPTAVCPIPLQAHLSPPPCAPPPPSCSWACWPGGCRLPPAAAACRSVSLPCRLPCPQLLCVAHTPLAALRAERPVPLPVPLFSLPVHSTAMPAYPPRCPPAAAAAAPLCAPWPRRLSTASSWSSPTVSGGPAGLPTGVLPSGCAVLERRSLCLSAPFPFPPLLIRTCSRPCALAACCLSSLQAAPRASPVAPPRTSSAATNPATSAASALAPPTPAATSSAPITSSAPAPPARTAQAAEQWWQASSAVQAGATAPSAVGLAGLHKLVVES